MQPWSGSHAHNGRSRYLRGDDGAALARKARQEAEAEARWLPLQAAALSRGRSSAEAGERARGNGEPARSPAWKAMPAAGGWQQPRGPAAAGEEAAKQRVAERPAEPRGPRKACSVGVTAAVTPMR